MVEISGISRLDKENSLDLVTKMAELAKFTNFTTTQIDVAHRTSIKEDAPIIVMFHSRTDRETFYGQRSKLKCLHVRQFDDDKEQHKYTTEDEQKKRDPRTKIYLNESLTPEIQKLLAETRKKTKELKSTKSIEYKYVWTNHGHIRVRKNETSQMIKINCMSDIQKIK